MGTDRPKQLSLNVHLSDDATFDNFYAPDNSHSYQALCAVRTLVEGSGERFVYVWGPEGVGVSHLLQAACHEAAARNISCQYLPLEELAGYAAQQLLEGLDNLDLICLDGVQHVMGQHGWDEAMFHLYNRMRDNRCRMIVSADCPPRQLGSRLPDLISRLGWGVVFHMQELTDEEKQEALKRRAHARGMDLPDDVCRFILARAPREMVELFYYLDRLDHASMDEKRKLTIPFVKQALGW